MARSTKKSFEQHTSDDALTIKIKGDRRNPEPALLVIQFPGGHVEISRCSDGTYWAHLEVVDPKNTVDSRIDYTHEGWVAVGSIPEIPRHDQITKLAVRVANKVPRFNPDDAA